MKLLFLRACEKQEVGSWAQDEIADLPDEHAEEYLKLGYAIKHEPRERKPTPRTNQVRLHQPAPPAAKA